MTATMTETVMTDAEVQDAMAEVRQILEPEPHWLTRYDPRDGDAYGEVCHCPRGLDHNAPAEALP